MRFALFSLGSRGDTQPTAAYGLALHRRGHAVTLCAPENFASLIQGLGLDFAPQPWDTRRTLDDTAVRDRLLQGDVIGFFRKVQKEAIQRQPELQEAWIQAAQDADVLVASSTTEEALTLLGQALQKPVLYTELMPFAPSSRFAPIALGPPNLGPLNAPLHWITRQIWWRVNRPSTALLAKRLGLPTPTFAPTLRAQRKGAKTLHGFSPALFPPPADWADDAHYTSGAFRLSADDARALPGDHHDAGFEAWLEDGPPPVFLSFGSMPAMQGLDLLELAGDLAETLDLRVVLGTGWTELDVAGCDLPEGVAISAECDHAWLFERCCAVVHHGGAGTTHAAAAAGLPQVVCPFFADQPFWAARVRASGAGLSLPFKRLSLEGLAVTLSEALQGGCQDAAAALAARIHTEPGADGAAQRTLEWFRA